VSAGQPAKAAELRRRARERAASRPVPPPGLASPEDLQRLIQELKIRQAELEIQNEELIETRARLEEAGARYTDLYDFAPLACFTLGRW